MVRHAVVLAAAVAGLAAAAVPTSAAAERPLVVLSSRIRLPARARDGVLRGKISMEADYLSSGRAFDAREDSLCVMLGPCGILRRGQIDGVVGREDEWGDWTLRARNPWGKGTRVVMHFSPGTGRFDLAAKGVDLSMLAAASGGTFPVQFLAGPELYAGDAAFSTAANGRTWIAAGPGTEYAGLYNESQPPPGTSGSGLAGLGGSGIGGEVEEPLPSWWNIDIGDPGVGW